MKSAISPDKPKIRVHNYWNNIIINENGNVEKVIQNLKDTFIFIPISVIFQDSIM